LRLSAFRISLVVVEIGDVGDPAVDAVLLDFFLVRIDVRLQRPEQLREFDMLVGRQLLRGENQHAVLPERGLDRVLVFARQRLPEVHVADFRGKVRRDRKILIAIRLPQLTRERCPLP
jgi:hypothetical protein